jgi:D-3-phosphoglycerate dehydrogenase / 2-oxoglutarate reductase
MWQKISKFAFYFYRICFSNCHVKMKKILFIDSTHPLLPEALEQAGFTCEQPAGYTYSDYLKVIHNYTGIIIRSGITLNRQLLDKAVNLKFIGRVGAGMENIDANYASSIGITCLNAPEGNRDALGEHTVGMLLVLLNNLLRSDQQVRHGIWSREENRGEEIMGKTVGIIGYGNMGSAFAKRLSGFGARVIAYDKYKTGYADGFVEELDMETIFRETDILSLHVPLTAETDYLIDSSYLERFTKPIRLINTARGRVVKTADLVQKMKEGKVLGAALDVIEYEKKTLENLEATPEDFQYLAKSDHVVLTPHIAGWTHESAVKLAKVLVDKILEKFSL